MQDRNSVKAASKAASSGIPGAGWNSLRSAMDLFKKRWVFILAVFLIVFLALGAFQYIRNLHTASTVLSLDYEEASQGLTPNRTWFNVYEIRSREVMERLIGYAGLEGRITPDELSNCISVKATHDKNVSGNVNYISTSFVVTFKGAGAARETQRRLAAQGLRTTHTGRGHVQLENSRNSSAELALCERLLALRET